MYKPQDKWNREEQMLNFAGGISCLLQTIITTYWVQQKRCWVGNGGREGARTASIKLQIKGGSRVGDSECHIWEVERNAFGVLSQSCTHS